MLNPSVDLRLAEGLFKLQGATLSCWIAWNARYSLPGKLRFPVMVSSVMR